MRNVIENVKIVGVSSCVPACEIYNREMKNFSSDEISKIIDNTGVENRHVVGKACSSDLCYEAAINLLSQLDCPLDSIDIVIFVSQTPDYVLPATACVLQHRLGLSKNVMAFDINLGCSGYVYGLIVAAQLLCTGVFKRALLLTGDTISKLASPLDRSVAFLFGDAGAATLLEFDKVAPPIYFDYGTDGSGYDRLIVEGGGFRSSNKSLSQSDFCCDEYDADNRMLSMDGAEVFSFTIDKVPKTILKTLEYAGWLSSDVDTYFFHQANGFMLKYLIKKLNIEPSKVPLILENFGNTSVASIPLALTLTLASMDTSVLPSKKFVLTGFGVGFSWATIACTFNDTKILDVEYYNDNATI